MIVRILSIFHSALHVDQVPLRFNSLLHVKYVDNTETHHGRPKLAGIHPRISVLGVELAGHQLWPSVPLQSLVLTRYCETFLVHLCICVFKVENLEQEGIPTRPSGVGAAATLKAVRHNKRVTLSTLLESLHLPCRKIDHQWKARNYRSLFTIWFTLLLRCQWHLWAPLHGRECSLQSPRITRCCDLANN